MYIDDTKRKFRKYLVNKVVDMVRKTRFGDELGGFLLKVLHFVAPWLLLKSAAYDEKNGALASMGGMFCALSLYIFLGGCFLSDAERILGAGDFNVVDPYIRLFNQPVNNVTRYDYTIFGAYFAFSLMLVILHYRGLI